VLNQRYSTIAHAKPSRTVTSLVVMAAEPPGSTPANRGVESRSAPLATTVEAGE
jgi:hypothetical protein